MNNLDFRNVTLVSDQISTIPSRSYIDTSTYFCGVKLDIPIVASPMKDVCDGKTARLIRDLGGFAFLHRFCTIEEQVAEFKKSEKTAGCAIGIIGDWWDRLEALCDAGCTIFCLDVANGASTNVMDALKKAQDYYYNKAILKGSKYIIGFVTGNVCSASGYDYLHFDSVGVRVGVAGGAGCTTKNATGIYHPMLSLIKDCYYSVKHSGDGNKIICDGGIREPGDFCKALIFGANTVMMGSQIAACKDSPAEYAERDYFGFYDEYCRDDLVYWNDYKIYRGSASFENQQLYKETPRYIEGTTRYLECKETIEDMFQRYRDGLVSSMSYFNARNLQEYRNNIGYVQI